MLPTQSSLALGSPRFATQRLAELASTQGALAAWIEALAQDAKTAACGVTGEFAVGLREPGGRTFLAIDRFAVHTLCYRVADGQLLFSDRADALADNKADLDPNAIFDYLYFHVIPSPRTIFKGVYRLPPGHYALYENGHLTVAPYWTPKFEEQLELPFDVRKDEFKRLLRDAVCAQLDGTKSACFLSGGTDSSTVAGMAAMTGAITSTYSIGFDAQGFDEMEFSRLASKHFKTDHHEYYVTPDDLVRSIPAVAAHFDQPFGNSSVLPTYYCAKMAREDGASKLLAGDGGDELFGGNSRYAKQRVFGWYENVPRLIKNRFLEPMLGTHAAASFALTRKAGSYVEQARVPMPDRLQMYNLIMRLEPHKVLTPRLLAQMDVNSPLQLQQSVWNGTHDCSSLNKELAFDWRFTLAESDLPKVTGATGLAGMRVGFPMLDQHLLTFSLKLPTDQKLKRLQLRWFFKEALRDFLPKEILIKKKQGFGLPFGVWVNSNLALKKLATDSLHSLSDRGVVQVEFIHLLLTKRLPEHPSYYGEMVWILMMLEHWIQHHATSYRIR